MVMLADSRVFDAEQLSADLATIAPRLEGETDEEYGLFCRFVSLPPSQRRVNVVARQFGVSPARVAGIAVAHRWIERAREHDLAVLASVRADLAHEIIEAARATTDLIRAVTQRILDTTGNLEFSAVQIDRILNALSNILPVLFQLMPSQQQTQSYSPAAVQNVVLMQLMQLQQSDNRAVPVHTSAGVVTDGQSETVIIPYPSG